jgi:hypothetical protein
MGQKERLRDIRRGQATKGQIKVEKERSSEKRRD